MSVTVRRAAAALLALGALLAAGAPLTQGAPLRSSAVGVGEREFTITPYRRSVPRGDIRFNVTNYGEDGHNLVVLAPGGRRMAASPEIRAGARYTLRARLKRPGVYRLVCTTADHSALGMRSRIRVLGSSS